MRSCLILLSNHLAEETKLLADDVYILCEPLPRPQFKFHKLRLAYTRAVCMASKFKMIIYQDLDRIGKDYMRIKVYDPLDFDILDLFIKKFNSKLEVLELQKSFMLDQNKMQNLRSQFSGRKWVAHSSFYKQVKSMFHILENVDSTDKENRKPLPKTHKLTTLPPRIRENNSICKSAIDFVNAKFPNNPGETDFLYSLPLTKKQAEKYYAKFLRERFALFGTYQDAIHSDDVLVYHSHISYLLNHGLLTPQYVIKKALKAPNIPPNSREAFIRQVLGWREFCRFIYCYYGRQMKKQLIQHKGKQLPFKQWYTGTTGIMPIDNEISKVIKYAWSHHIVRLMVFLNFMKLNNIKAFDIYKWFSEFVSLDVVEYLMVSNIAAMGYYAHNPKFTHKPYLSSSNYIRTMSNYKNDGKWNISWDKAYRKKVDYPKNPEKSY